ISTAALCSKADLTVDDFALVNLEGNQVAGTKPRSSEILLHIEIYRAVPTARAVVHCHPPHATAYALTGTVPPGCLVPEHEVLVGSVALAPYETPGTPEFARTVLPYVRDHNVIFLQNHGVVCWADSVTHAEWCVEVVDTYCRTIMLASHLDAPLVPIPNRKAGDLLEIKKKLGLPDARYGLKECQLCDLPEFPEGLTVRPQDRLTEDGSTSVLEPGEVDEMVRTITDRLMAALKRTE
ncbi:MAG TPA: class II aldolase/adducin family protein, partial [Acidobacteriota bacterium]|nr:class II aldolase/adducin family protein [Acidobacteriota bacterium]